MMHNYHRSTLFIDGHWARPDGDGFVEVVDPATEEVIGSVPNGSQADVDAAVAAARRAFDPLITVAERRDRLAAVIDAMEKRLADMDRDGVRAEVLYPSMARNFYSLSGEETPLQLAGLCSYNDWLIEYCKAVPGRLVVKAGAEGLEAAAILPGARGEGAPASGLAVKIEDGGGYERGAWAATVMP